MGKEEKTFHKIKTEDQIGEVIISEEVVAVIAGLAAMDVDGVASMAGNATRAQISKLGGKALAKGVRADILEGTTTIVLTLVLKYGYNIMDVSEKVQEKVKTTVESTAGLQVADVNIRVAGVEVSA